MGRKLRVPDGLDGGVDAFVGLGVEDAREHVFCFFRNIEGLPEDGRAEGYRDLVGPETVTARPSRTRRIPRRTGF